MIPYLSVFSGIEAATVAWHPLGFKPVAYAEVDPFASHVLNSHYGSGRPRFMPSPDTDDLKDKDRKARRAAIKSVKRLPENATGTPNLGDVTQFRDWPDYDVRLLVGGSPCQSFSVAGLRKGLADPRGNLALTYLAIADRYRPEWLLWENVPGVLSSNGGEDFRCFLSGLARWDIPLPTGGWQNSGIINAAPVDGAFGVAWRVLDAQYVRVDGFARAVPQRRRRVFVVGYTGDWRRAAAVLFERESLSWNSPPRRQAGERVAPTIASRPTGGGGLGTDFDCDGGLIPTIPERSLCLNGGGGMGRIDAESETLIPVNRCFFDDAAAVTHSLRADGLDASEDGTGRGTPLVAFQTRGSNLDVGEITGTLGVNGGSASGAAPCIAFDTTQITSKANRSNPQSGDACHPLAAEAHPPAIAIQERAISENPDAGPDGVGVRTDGVAYTLEARTVPQAVAFDSKASGRNGFGVGEISPTLRAMGHKDSHQNSGGQVAVAQAWAVRRLTPRECERLQAYYDDYTLIDYYPASNRKLEEDYIKYLMRGGVLTREQCFLKAADGPRYKALGNSMAVNVMRWLGTRIQLVDEMSQSLYREAAE